MTLLLHLTADGDRVTFAYAPTAELASLLRAGLDPSGPGGVGAVAAALHGKSGRQTAPVLRALVPVFVGLPGGMTEGAAAWIALQVAEAADQFAAALWAIVDVEGPHSDASLWDPVEGDGGE